MSVSGFFRALGGALPRRNSRTSLPVSPNLSSASVECNTTRPSMAPTTCTVSASSTAVTSFTPTESLESTGTVDESRELKPVSSAPNLLPTASGPVCRFCLEDVCENSEEDNENMRVVAPCACRGSGALVHLGCLRRWQTSVLCHRLHRESLARAVTCPVCTETLVVDGLPLEPKVPAVVANGVCIGSLLVATENLEGEGRTFNHSVILVCKATQSGRIWGVDLARAVDASDVVCQAAESCLVRNADEDFLEVSVRIGGPVCGGRLGLVNYVALSTMPDATGPAMLLQPIENSVPIGHSQLYGPDTWDGAGMDARTSLDFLRRTLQRVQSRPQLGRREFVLLFRGHAAWGRGQLEGEIHRGNWATCLAKPEDIFATPVAELWNRLRSSGRLARHDDF